MTRKTLCERWMAQKLDSDGEQPTTLTRPCRFRRCDVEDDMAADWTSERLICRARFFFSAFLPYFIVLRFVLVHHSGYLRIQSSPPFPERV